jgi:hypothetical protein
VRSRTTAALALALLACGDGGEPLGPASEGPAELAPQYAVTKGRAKYDAAAAKVVVDDLLNRVMPTLTPGAPFDALSSDLQALAAALIQPDLTTLRVRVDAVKESLKSYGRTAPEAEEPELGSFDFSLDIVSEGLPKPASGPGKR